MVSLRSLVIGATALAAPVMAAITPAQWADGIKQLTAQSLNLQGPAQSITVVNAPLIVIGQGPFPDIIRRFTEIVTTATVIIDQLPGTPKITSPADATLVFDAFHQFVRVHQDLLNILIGKSGILTKVPLIGPPVATVLRQVEGVVDQLAIALIDTVESRTDDFESDANSLGASFDTCIKQYEGLSVKKRSGGATFDAVKPGARVFVA